MKRIALVADHLGWCFGHMARSIQRCAPKDFQVEVFDGAEFSKYTDAPKWLAETFDAVCQFSWTESSWPLPVRNVFVLAHEGATFKRRQSPWPGPLLTTDLRNMDRACKIFPQADAILCFNDRLASFVRHMGRRAIVCPPGVDRLCFFPGHVDHVGPIRVGWCGQPVPQKGYREVLFPIMERCPQVEWRINDRTAATAICPAKMADWYCGNDLLLCTAISEGGPLPVLESLACGVPVLSTPVGIVPDIREGVALLPAINSLEDIPAVIEAAVERIRAFERSETVDAAAFRESRRWDWTHLAGRWLEAIAG